MGFLKRTYNGRKRGFRKSYDGKEEIKRYKKR